MGGDGYLASTSTQSRKDVWLIDSDASFYMTPQMEWFCEYEKQNGGYFLVGDDLTTNTIGRGREKWLLKDGRIRTPLGILHIPDLARNSISISKMNNVDVNIVFKKDISNGSRRQY